MTHRGPFQPRTFCDSVIYEDGQKAAWQPGVREEVREEALGAARPGRRCSHCAEQALCSRRLRDGGNAVSQPASALSPCGPLKAGGAKEHEPSWCFSNYIIPRGVFFPLFFL